MVRARRCPRCGNYGKQVFPKTRSSYRLKDGTVVRKEYELKYCHACLRRQKNRAERQRGPRKRTSEEKTRNNHLPSSKAARRRYRKTKKGKRTGRRSKIRARRKALRLLTAPVPVEIIQPYLTRLLETRTQRGLELETGVSARTQHAILKGERRGATLETLDGLAQTGEFTVEEIYDRAKEWAFLTKDSWPDGYQRGRPVVRS
jgi:hypothetical protein